MTEEKEKKTKWLVIRKKFDENELQFKSDGCITLDGDAELLKFIREVMSKAGENYLWQITYCLSDS